MNRHRKPCPVCNSPIIPDTKPPLGNYHRVGRCMLCGGLGFVSIELQTAYLLIKSSDPRPNNADAIYTIYQSSPDLLTHAAREAIRDRINLSQGFRAETIKLACGRLNQ